MPPLNGTAPDYSYYTLSFRVMENALAGTDITLNMHITDKEGNEWEDEFSEEVY